MAAMSYSPTLAKFYSAPERPVRPAFDAAIQRNGVGILEVNNGTAGQYRDLKVRNMQVQAGGKMSGAGAVPQGGTAGQHLMKNTGTDYDASWQTPGATKVIWLTTTGAGTFTPDAGCRALFVECVGGGGGSAGSLGTAGSAAVAGGGGGGSYAAKYFAGPVLASYTYTVGAGGAAGAATPTAGGTGGDTLFDTLTAFGGTGSGIPVAGTTAVVSGGGGAAQAGVFNGDVYMNGGRGEHGYRIGGAAGGTGGYGATSLFANSVGANTTIGTAGTAGYNYGGGAAGGNSATATGVAGAAGGQGAIKITEYF